MTEADPKARVRSLFLDDEGYYGCAETALVALQEHFGLSEPGDSSPAMILNGGVAYSGGVCGALTGAGLALGRLAAERIDGHREAKATARRILMRLMAEFREEFGATDCRTLTGYDMIEDHDEFMEDGTWKTTCTRQLEYVVERLESLHDPDEWAAILQEMEIS